MDAKEVIERLYSIRLSAGDRQAEVLAEALLEAREIVRKEIPMEVYYDEYWQPRCARCGMFLSKLMKYCPMCGQRYCLPENDKGLGGRRKR